MRHSRSKDFLRPGQGVIFVPPIPDPPRNTPTFYGRFCALPRASTSAGGIHNVKGKLFLIVERCNGVLTEVWKRRDETLRC
jgi:hypothetical protein